MDSLTEITKQIVSFRDARDWKQFHTPKDMMLSLLLEAAELAEIAQWKNGADLEQVLRERSTEVGEELSDVLYWVLLIAHDLGIDIGQAFTRKMEKNAAKYPCEEARGRSLKYDALARTGNAKIDR